MIFYLCAAAAWLTAAQEISPTVSTSSVLPTYVALSPDLNAFSRFADGGADANWYIGYNNAWIVKLPQAPAGDWARAFVGAKIGRAKTRPNLKKPWLREVLEGKIYIGISSIPSFAPEQSFFLAETADLPLEADPQAHVEGVGSAEWLWTEVPLSLVGFTRPNYLIIWSPTKYFLRASSSPILAASAAEDPGENKEPRAWNNRSISGVPPRIPSSSLETPLNNIYPALALKLVPASQFEINVSEFSFQRTGRKAVVRFSVGGENVAEAWVEASRDQLDWERVSQVLRRQPFQFSITAEKLPAAGRFLRGAARDAIGTTGFSAPFRIP